LDAGVSRLPRREDGFPAFGDPANDLVRGFLKADIPFGLAETPISDAWLFVRTAPVVWSRLIQEIWSLPGKG